MSDFIITVRPGKTEVHLSRPGWWGNLPYASYEDAERMARQIDPNASITREVIRAARR